MTETSSADRESGFRCASCEAILTAGEMTLGKCRDCLVHAYDPDPANSGATCLVCGYDESFGRLHTTPPAPVADGYELPPVCPTCTHYDHSLGECRVVIVRWPTTRVCGCRQVPAEAGAA